VGSPDKNDLQTPEKVKAEHLKKLLSVTKFTRPKQAYALDKGDLSKTGSQNKATITHSGCSRNYTEEKTDEGLD
jgi:hypothetical protein